MSILMSTPMSTRPKALPPSPRAACREALIAGLRKAVAGCAGGPAGAVRADVSLGEGLPGLPSGGLHEVMAGDPRDYWAALAFALGVAGVLTSVLAGRGGREGRGAVVWLRGPRAAREYGVPYGPGLAALGLAPARLVIACPQKAGDLLWGLEEAVRTKGVVAALGELGPGASVCSLTQSRRLQLAAEAAATPLLLLRGAGEAPPTAALSRWRVSGRASGLPPWEKAVDGEMAPPGAPAWRCVLERSKMCGRASPVSGGPRAWEMEWDHETHSFRLAAPLAGRVPEAAKAGPDGRGRVLPFARSA